MLQLLIIHTDRAAYNICHITSYDILTTEENVLTNITKSYSKINTDV